MSICRAAERLRECYSILCSTSLECRAGCLQVGFAFRSVENALTMIVRNLESFSGLAAETERLDALAAGPPTPLYALHITSPCFYSCVSSLQNFCLSPCMCMLQQLQATLLSCRLRLDCAWGPDVSWYAYNQNDLMYCTVTWATVCNPQAAWTLTSTIRDNHLCYACEFVMALSPQPCQMWFPQ